SLEKARTGMIIHDNQIDRGGFSRISSAYNNEGDHHQIIVKGTPGDTFTWNIQLNEMPTGTAALIVNSVTGKTWIMDGSDQGKVTISEPMATYDAHIGQVHNLLELQKDLMPTEIALMQNYPDPFNPMTNIRYSLPEEQIVRLEVFDLLGRQVMVLQNGVQAAGWHLVQFDASLLSSGVYMYRL